MKLMQYPESGVFYIQIGQSPWGDGTRGQHLALGSHGKEATERAQRILDFFMASGQKWTPETVAQAKLIGRGKA
jgi:hypothetical protein